MAMRILGYEQLESRLALAVSVVESENIGYFFDTESNIVQRYDIDHETWLDAIALENTLAGSQVVCVDSDGIYVGFGRAVYRYGLDGTSKTHLTNVQYAVISIHSNENLLFVNYSFSGQTRFVSISKTNNLIVDSIVKSNYYYGDPPVFAIAPGANKLFGVSSWYSSLQLSSFTYGQDGKLTQGYQSISYYGDYSPGVRSWVFPDESKIIHNSGAVIATSDLRLVNRITSIDDIDYLENEIPFVMQGNQITAYSKAFLPTGKVDLGSKAIKFFVNSIDVVAFFSDPAASRRYRIQRLPITDFHPADPSIPIDPTGLAYTPDWIAVSNQARVLLLSKAQQNIFVWNPMSLSYQRSIGLLSSPNAVAYDPITDLIYVAYDSGLICKIDLTASEPKEVPFLKIPGRPIVLTIAGSFIFVAEQSSYRYNHSVFSRDGELLSSKEHYEQYQDYAFNPANQSMYYLRSGGYSSVLIYQPIDPMGRLLAAVSSSTSDYFDTSRPIRFTPDGKSVLIGSGAIFDAQTLKQSPYSLANSVSDAVWFAGRWVTIRDVAGVPQLQQWPGQSFEPVYVMQWPNGTGFSVKALTSKRMIVTVISSQGVPTFSILDENLQSATVNNTWHNQYAPMDVDDDEFVSPLDILMMIDQLNLYGSRQIINVGEHYCDTDNDGLVTPLDILLVIDWINLQESNESKPNGESPLNLDSVFMGLDDWLAAYNKRRVLSSIGR
jgi:hypothetical protein